MRPAQARRVTAEAGSAPELGWAGSLVAVDELLIVGAAIVCHGRVLAQRRAYPPESAGFWELPGGRVEPAESEVDAVRRECLEELGVDVRVGPRVGADVSLAHGVLRIFAAELVCQHARASPREHAELRWLDAPSLSTVDWLPADWVLLPNLAVLLGSAGADES